MANISELLNVGLHKNICEVNVMSITELTMIARKQSKTRNHSQRVALLKAADIIGSDGYFSEKSFSTETVEKDRKSGRKPTI